MPGRERLYLVFRTSPQVSHTAWLQTQLATIASGLQLHLTESKPSAWWTPYLRRSAPIRKTHHPDKMVGVPGMKGVDLELDRFDNGSFRSAFRATVTKDGYRDFNPGQRLVFKALRAGEYNQGERLSDRDVEAQTLLKMLCDSFNRRGYSPIRMHAVVGHIIRFPVTMRNTAGKRVICRREKVLIEPMLDGRFIKFNSNDGWASSHPRHALAQAFSHWTWVQSGRKFGQRYLIADLQGVRSANAFVFTDPAVLSETTRQFGMADLGKSGINEWFRRHRCNEHCKKLGIVDKVPREIKMERMSMSSLSSYRLSNTSGLTPSPRR